MMVPFPRRPDAYRSFLARSFRWASWDALIRTHGVTIDRPAHTAHPSYPTIIYPLDYGYVNNTMASDDEPVDCFVGTADTGLVGLIATTDYRQRDREVKLLWNCSPPDIYMAHGFINYDRTLLEGLLVLRQAMHALWPSDPSTL